MIYTTPVSEENQRALGIDAKGKIG